MIHSEKTDNLRTAVGKFISGHRLSHTLGVEECAARMAELYCPEKEEMLQTAALLHDITKEWPTEKQVAYCESHRIPLRESDVLAYKTLHAMTASVLAGEEFPDWVTPEVQSAVRWHTTGHENMTLTECILYLADYIEQTRTFPDCVKLREMFWSAQPEKMDAAQRMTHLYRVMLVSYDMTIRELLEAGAPISADTILARNDLICRLKKM